MSKVHIFDESRGSTVYGFWTLCKKTVPLEDIRTANNPAFPMSKSGFERFLETVTRQAATCVTCNQIERKLAKTDDGGNTNGQST